MSETHEGASTRWAWLGSVTWGAITLCLLGAAFMGPALRWTSPRHAVSVWAADPDEQLDPWGRRYGEAPIGPRATVSYSWGPNGVDEGGAGDDLVAEWSDVHVFLDGLPACLAILAVVLAWSRLPLWRRPRSPSLRDEVATAWLCASVPTAALAASVRWALYQDWEPSERAWSAWKTAEAAGLAGRTPLVLVVTSSAFLLLGLLALSWRLTRPGPQAPE